MTKKPDTLNPEQEQGQSEQRRKREEVLKALRRLRKISENLPTVDAAAVVRASRDLTGQG